MVVDWSSSIGVVSAVLQLEWFLRVECDTNENEMYVPVVRFFYAFTRLLGSFGCTCTRASCIYRSLLWGAHVGLSCVTARGVV